MMPNFKGLLEKIGGQFSKANKKSTELTQVSKIKLSIITVKREIEEKLLQLGAKSYEMLKKGNGADLLKALPIRHLVEQLKELEDELEKYKRQLEQIREKNTLK